ncbi:glycosyltransferase family 2 protein [Dyadobacter aurulentus]|uniref:glycosyltransferase family 2 protein n=1 Tax=Dyadobacter sp. UC 10 TaxID=2605428 RepID=UPI001788E116|nr:glycosyltransferase family 2 protein [Dyadobacter sp. UC 10]
MIYIVIPVFNRIQFTLECLASLSRQTYRDFKIIVVDHGSTDNTSHIISQKFPDVTVLTGDDSMWWTAATNLGIKYILQTDADYILTLNNDLIVGPDYMKTLADAAAENSHSLIGSVSIDIANRNRVVFCGTIWNNLTAKYSRPVDLNMSYEVLRSNYKTVPSSLLPGRGTLIPTKVFQEIGFFDDIRFPHYMADEDLSYRAAQRGYKLLVNVKSAVYSHVSATGLSNVHIKKDWRYWNDFFNSIRSPNNFTLRRNWAFRNGRIPLLYFLFDYSRIMFSQLRKLRTQ